MKKIILVTGSAGFIGYHTSLKLLKLGYSVIGIDNLNNYYDPKLKIDRNRILKENPEYIFELCELSNKFLTSIKLRKLYIWQHKLELGIV